MQLFGYDRLSIRILRSANFITTVRISVFYELFFLFFYCLLFFLFFIVFSLHFIILHCAFKLNEYMYWIVMYRNSVIFLTAYRQCLA